MCKEFLWENVNPGRRWKCGTGKELKRIDWIHLAQDMDE